MKKRGAVNCAGGKKTDSFRVAYGYVLMILASASMATTGGLLIDSSAIVTGSMWVAGSRLWRSGKARRLACRRRRRPCIIEPGAIAPRAVANTMSRRKGLEHTTGIPQLTKPAV